MRSVKPDTARGLFGLNQYYTTLTRKIEKLPYHAVQNGFPLRLLSLFISLLLFLHLLSSSAALAKSQAKSRVEAGNKYL